MKNETLVLAILAICVLGGGFYYFSKSNVENKTGAAIQTEVANPPGSTNNALPISNGFATGKICSPSDAGYIEAKRLSDGKFFIQNVSASTYRFELGPEKYHLRYVVGGIGDYGAYSYNFDQKAEVVEAIIESGKALSYDLCQTSTTDLESF